MRPPRSASMTAAWGARALALVLVAGGSAVGAAALVNAATAPSPRVYVCVKKAGEKKGQMRLVGAKAKCVAGEFKKSWSVQGPRGPAGPGLERGAVAYFNLARCPGGWSDFGHGKGRYIVGRPEGGTLGALVGTPLGNQENRAVGQHTHGVTDPGHYHLMQNVSPIYSGGNVTPTRLAGTTAGNGAFNGTLPNTAGIPAMTKEVTHIGIDTAGGVPGTNAPYVQLLACVKG
jgi:hypothetical protein